MGLAILGLISSSGSRGWAVGAVCAGGTGAGRAGASFGGG